MSGCPTATHAPANTAAPPAEGAGWQCRDDYFKSVEFCSMCGPKYCPMHNFTSPIVVSARRAIHVELPLPGETTLTASGAGT